MTPAQMEAVRGELQVLVNEYREITAEINRLTERLERCRDKMRAVSATIELMKSDDDADEDE